MNSYNSVYNGSGNSNGGPSEPPRRPTQTTKPNTQGRFESTTQILGGGTSKTQKSSSCRKGKGSLDLAALHQARADRQRREETQPDTSGASDGEVTTLDPTRVGSSQDLETAAANASGNEVGVAVTEVQSDEDDPIFQRAIELSRREAEEAFSRSEILTNTPQDPKRSQHFEDATFEHKAGFTVPKTATEEELQIEQAMANSLREVQAASSSSETLADSLEDRQRSQDFNNTAPGNESGLTVSKVKDEEDPQPQRVIANPHADVIETSSGSRIPAPKETSWGSSGSAPEETLSRNTALAPEESSSSSTPPASEELRQARLRRLRNEDSRGKSELQRRIKQGGMYS